MAQLYQLVDYQEYLEEQPVTNVYYYYNTTETGVTAQQLVDAWVTNVLPFVREIQGVAVAHMAVGAYDVLHPMDAHLRELVGVFGNAPGDADPSFSSFSFTCNVAGNLMKSGGKRYAGTTDDTVSGNSPAALIATDLANMGEALPLPLLIGGAVLRYVITRFTSPGIYDLAAVAFAIFRAVSTQNSRKAGTSSFVQPGIYWSQDSASPTFPVDLDAFLAARKAALSGMTVRLGYWQTDGLGGAEELAGIDQTYP